MKNIKQDFEKNRFKYIAGIAIVAILVFVIASIAHGFSINAFGPEENSQPEQEQPVEGDTPKKEESKLSQEQVTAKAMYSPEILEFISLLEANTWTANNETKSIVFSNGVTFKERSSSSENETHYTITALDIAKSTDGANTTYTSAINTGKESFIMTCTATTAGNGIGMSVTSSAFNLSKSYARSTAALTFAIEGMTDKMDTLIGNTTPALTEQLREYCALTYPTASKATWDKTATVDWEYNTVGFSVKLDNSSKTQVALTYHMDTKIFDIGGVK